MASSVHVAGPAQIKVDTAAGNSLEELGYTINGAEIREEIFHSNVPGDENGGDEGPPIDVQYFGEIHHVRLELSKWDASVANKVLAKLYGGTAGVLGAAGTLMAGGSKTVRLLINASIEPRNYLKAFLRNQSELNKGTKYSKLVLEFECHANGVGGTVYNTTIT
jgi:hypothetical protein